MVEANQPLKMTSKHFIPVLDELMKWHLYIGNCQTDKEPVLTLHKVVCSLGLSCCLRSSLDVLEVSTKQNIEEGINFSQICLLYVSPNYIDDDKSIYELQEAERKLQYFGKKAVVAMIEPTVDHRHFERFSKFTMINLEKVKPDLTELNAHLMDILSEFELKPILSTIPKSNIGVGVAITYYYGFLQLQLSAREDSTGFSNNLRKAFGQDAVDWDCVVKKMLIIIPESVNSPPKLAEPGSLEQTNWTVKQFACRSGWEKREYSVPVFKLNPSDGQKSYYLVGDIPACLFALYEAHGRHSAGLSKSELYQARNEFCFTLKGLLNHPDNLSQYGNQWEMLVWPDTEESPNRKKLSEFLYEEIEAKQLTTAVAEVQFDGPIQATTDTKTYLRQKGIQHSTVYRDIETYPLQPNHRSRCVIINNSTFHNNPCLERTGADVESDNLKKLFTDLHFEVDLQKNLSASEMQNCLEYYGRCFDHRNHEAFVCCILSHGSYGSVCGADGNPVTVLSLMKLFYDDQCPSLKGKPKLFFMGACQTDEPGPSRVKERGTMLLPDASPDTSSDVVTPDASPDTSSEVVTRHNLVPSSSDFIVSYATLPETMAFAHPDYGGIYVEALCKTLREDREIYVALKKVSSEVESRLKYYSEEHNESYTVQKPFQVFVTQKLLFLSAEI